MDPELLRILHLEDVPADAELVHRSLEGSGVAVEWHTVGDGRAFRAALEDEESFDAIVSDQSVPDLEGLHALELARKQRSDVPFVFVCGDRGERHIKRCLAAGADDVVSKSQLWRLPAAMQHVRRRVERDRLARRERDMIELIGAIKSLSLARSVEQVMAIVRRTARALAHADGATFVLREGDQCHYADEDAIGPLWKGSRFPMSSCISGWAMHHGLPAVVPDIRADARIPLEAYEPTFVRSLVMVPIRSSAPIGAIGTYFARPHTADARTVELLQALADTTSVALENVQVFGTLEQRVHDRTEALLRANEELQAFSYSVSHDLHAPLRAAEGFATLLDETQRGRLDEEGRHFVGLIRSSVTRMRNSIDELLRLSRISRTELRMQAVDLGRMAREILAELQEAEPHRVVEIEVAAGMLARGDPGLLLVALENLLRNAWKYSARRAVAHIGVGMTTMPGDVPVYWVRDDGVGFDMAAAGELFQPFRRLHAEREFQGMGIGLAIVQRVIARHGGSVWAESAPGRGAIFRFTLGASDLSPNGGREPPR